MVCLVEMFRLLEVISIGLVVDVGFVSLRVVVVSVVVDSRRCWVW